MTVKRRKPLFASLKQSLEEAIAKVDQGAIGCGQQISKHSDLKSTALNRADVKAEYEALEPEFELACQRHRRRGRQ